MGVEGSFQALTSRHQFLPTVWRESRDSFHCFWKKRMESGITNVASPIKRQSTTWCFYSLPIELRQVPLLTSKRKGCPQAVNRERRTWELSDGLRMSIPCMFPTYHVYSVQSSVVLCFIVGLCLALGLCILHICVCTAHMAHVHCIQPGQAVSGSFGYVCYLYAQMCSVCVHVSVDLCVCSVAQLCREFDFSRNLLD